MVDFLQRLQDSSFGVWVSTSPSLLAYPTILTLHTVGLAMVVGSNTVLNLRIFGIGRLVPFDALRPTFRVMALGLVVNVSTGLALFISEAAEKGTTVIFWIKLAVIAAALIVATLIRRRVFGATSSTATISEASHGLRALAVLSCVLWTGAIFAGRLMAYLE